VHTPATMAFTNIDCFEKLAQFMYMGLLTRARLLA
jgi:hypothetical protein